MEKKDWYKVEIRELIRKNLNKIHVKIGDLDGIDVFFLHKMISEYVNKEIEKARKEGYEKGLEDSYDDYDGRLNNPEIRKKLGLSKLKDK